MVLQLCERHEDQACSTLFTAWVQLMIAAQPLLRGGRVQVSRGLVRLGLRETPRRAVVRTRWGVHGTVAKSWRQGTVHVKCAASALAVGRACTGGHHPRIPVPAASTAGHSVELLTLD